MEVHHMPRTTHPPLPPMPTAPKSRKGAEVVSINGSAPVGVAATLAAIDAALIALSRGDTEPGPKQPRRRPTIEVNPIEVAKIEGTLGSEVVDAFREMDHAELRERILTLSEHEIETEQAKSNDAELQAARERVSELQAPYNETAKFLRLRRRYAILLMQERGRPTS